MVVGIPTLAGDNSYRHLVFRMAVRGKPLVDTQVVSRMVRYRGVDNLA